MSSSPKEIFVEVPFHGQATKAHVLVYGSDSLADQILCLHGIGSTAGESFIEVAPILAQDFQVVAVDWIGCGKSSRLLGPGDSYSSDYCSEWLQNFVLAAQRQRVLRSKFNIFAISMSAIAISKIWRSIHEFVRKIIFVNPLGMDIHISKLFALALTHPWINHKKLANLLLSNFMWDHVFKWTERDKVRLKEGVKNGELEVLIRYAKAGILPRGRLKDINFVPDKFEKIEVPVLLLTSARDHVFYKRDYLKFAKKRKNWRAVELGHNDHNFMIAKAKEVAAETAQFLKETN